MNMKQTIIVIPVIATLFLSGCTTPPKEHTAPCKRTANALGYVDDMRMDCGSMRPINNVDQAMAAILVLGKQ